MKTLSLFIFACVLSLPFNLGAIEVPFLAGKKVINGSYYGLGVRLIDYDDDGDQDFVYLGVTDTLDSSPRLWLIENLGVGGFQNPLLLSTATDFKEITIGDIDGDGDADILATTTKSPYRLEWFENQGDGSFLPAAALTSPGTRYSTDFNLADLNGDGRLDILFASYSSVSWMENLGNANFQSQKRIDSVSSEVISAKAADIDGDGLLDVVSWKDEGFQVVWHRNTGNGQFADPVQVSSERIENCRIVVAADIDGDGRQDVLVGHKFNTDKIDWFRNEGGGNFSPSRRISSAFDGVFEVIVADVDKDGDTDILSRSKNENNIGKVAWYPNEGEGRFERQLEVFHGDISNSFATGDIDGDGDIDVAITSTKGFNWYENDRSAAPMVDSFRHSADGGNPGSPVTLSWEVRNADTLMLDGVPLSGNSVVVRPNQTTEYSLVASNSTGSITAKILVGVASAPMVHSFYPDLSNIAAWESVKLWWDVSDADRIEISPNVGEVTGNSVTVTPESGSLLLVESGSIWKYLDNGTPMDGTGWQQPGFNDTAWSTGSAQFGYGDGDETTVVGFGPSSTNKYITTYFRRTFQIDDPSAIFRMKLSLLRDDGAVMYINGLEVARENLPAGTITWNTLARNAAANENTYLNFTLDNIPLVAGTNTIAVEMHQVNATSSDMSFDLELQAQDVFLPVTYTLTAINGSGTTTSTATVGFSHNESIFDSSSRKIADIGSGNANNAAIAAADVDEDGLADIIMGLEATFLNGRIFWFKNNGNTTYSTSKYIGGSSYRYPRFVEVSDLNGDGLKDVVAAGSGDGGYLVWFPGKGGGSFGSGQKLPASGYPETSYQSITIGDFDGDGDNDVFGAFNNGIAPGEVWLQWFRNDGSGNFVDAGILDDLVTNVGGVKTADFNGDGMMDIVFWDRSDDSVTILIANGETDGFDDGVVVSSAVDYVTDVVLLDFNADGIMDMAATHRVNGFESLSVFIGDGMGGFERHPLNVNVSGTTLVAGDMDGDGLDDLIAGGKFYRNEGNGRVSGGIAIGTATAGRIIAVDLDGDFDLDVIVGDSVTLNLSDPSPVIQNFTGRYDVVKGKAVLSWNVHAAATLEIDQAVGIVEGNSIEVSLTESKTFTLTASSPKGQVSAKVYVVLDTDSDGLPDDWELRYFTDLSESPGGDPDGDGINTGMELSLGTNPAENDSDFDGILDNVELAGNTDPTKADTDGDGYDDGEELTAGTNATDPQNFPPTQLLDDSIFYANLDSAPFVNQVNGRNGIVQGNSAALTGPGRIGNALAFTPTLQRRVIFDNVDTLSDEIAYSFWFKMTAVVPGEVIFSMDQVNTKHVFKVVNGRLRVELLNALGGGDALESVNPLTPNLWYHVALSVSPSTIEGAINGDYGALNFSLPPSASFQSGQAPQLVLGAAVPTPATFQGSVDEVAVWRRLISHEEVSKLYSNGANGRGMGTINDRAVLPILTKQPKSGVFGTGERMILSIDYEGTEPLTVQWLRGGLEIPGATSKEFEIPALSLADSALYSARVTNQVGMVDSSGVLVRVIDFASRDYEPQTMKEREFETLAGTEVELSGDYMFVGVPNRYYEEVQVFKKDESSASGWRKVQTLGKPAGFSEYFGTEIAADGNWLAVSNQRNVYLYQRGTSGTWQFKQEITRDGAFGSGIAIQGDRLVVGAMQAHGNDVYSSGIVYVFERNTTNNIWEEKDTLIEGGEHDGLGFRVALDGDTIAATADGYGTFGAVYVFEKAGIAPDSWGLVGRLMPQELESNADFGGSLAIEGDIIAVGTPKADFGLLDAGAIFIFDRHKGGQNAWSQSALILNGRRAANHHFGLNVEIDNGRLYTTYWSDRNVDNGGFLVYERSNGENWTEYSRKYDNPILSQRRYGWTLSVDNNRAVVTSQTYNVFSSVNLENRYHYYEFPPAANSAPVFTGTPAIEASPELPYNAIFYVEEPDGHEVEIGATMLPGWLRLTQNGNGSVTLAGTPSAADVGIHAVQLMATDGFPDGTSFVDFQIAVERIPTILKITAEDPATSVFGELVTVHFTISADSTVPISIQPTGTITLSAPGSAPVTVTLPAASGIIRTGQSGTIDITATYSGDGTFFGNSDTATHLVIPEVRVTLEENAVPENGTAPVRFEITRTGTTQTELEVAVEIAGSALPDQDYSLEGSALPETLIIPVGESSVVVEFPLVDDNVEEVDESLSLEVLAGGYRIEDGASMETALILNDDFAPVAIADQWSVIEDSSLAIPRVAGVLANDTDLDDGDGPLNLFAELVETTAHGQLNLMPDGSVSYTPGKDFFGMDQFRYRATDGSNVSAPIIVTIQVLEQVDLTVALSESIDPLVVGHPQNNSVEHEITLTNNGPSHADNIRIDLSLVAPAGVTASSTNGTVWNVLRLLEGESVKMTIHFTAGASAEGGRDVIKTGAQVAGLDQTVVNGLDDVAEIATSIVSPQNVVALTLQEHEVLKLQTGLMVQQLEVTNNNPVAAAGFRVVVSGLPKDVTVYNATGTTPDGHSFVSYPQALGAGETVTLTIEFFSSRRSTDFSPLYEIQLLIAGDDSPSAPEGEKFAIDRTVRKEDGSILIEWNSKPGEHFIVEYSADMLDWKQAGDAQILAGANRTQWIDSGAPETDLHPLNVPSRYYRVSKVVDAPDEE